MMFFHLIILHDIGHQCKLTQSHNVLINLQTEALFPIETEGSVTSKQ